MSSHPYIKKCPTSYTCKFCLVVYQGGCSSKSCQSCYNVRQQYDQYVKKSRERGLIFEIDPVAFRSLVSKPCHYCGNAEQHSGLDRVDNFEDYRVENVVPCCNYCNILKCRLKVKDFFAHVVSIYNHSGLGKGHF